MDNTGTNSALSMTPNANATPGANSNMTQDTNFAQPNKKPTGLIIALIISSTIAVGLGVFCAALILNNLNNKDKCVTVADNSQNNFNSDEATNTNNSSNPQYIQARNKRNNERKQDMENFLSQITQYRANNAGKAPLDISEGGTDSKFNPDFVKKYIDTSCTTTTTTWVSSIRYANCGEEFSDPNGTPYSITVDAFTSIAPEINLTPNILQTGSGIKTELDNTIYLVGQAKCGESEGTATETNGKSDIALFYILEGGTIYCNDTQNW